MQTISRHAISSDEPTLLAACQEIDSAYNGYGKLLDWSWVWEADGEYVGFIQMVPYGIRDSTLPFAIDNCEFGIHGGYYHAATLSLKRPANLRILLSRFYDQYPFIFPHIMTLTPATMDGIQLDYRLGFHPSYYPKVWYRTHNHKGELPLMQRQLRARIALPSLPG